MQPIETDRLLITAWSEADLPDACRLWGDRCVMRYIDVRGGLDEEQVREKLRTEIERQNRWGVQYWKVVIKRSGEVAGCCGLRPYEPEKQIYELGFHLMQQHWGHGYAAEAARAVIVHAFDVLRVAKLFAGHHPANERSRELLGRLGFHYIGDRFYAPTGLNHPSYELQAVPVEFRNQEAANR